ncbi:PREDICTED: vacuolar [Prunus dulcis]|uniref:PREDICTED: vacuolar n=1 Tax=Prunus dulcis TaxID=3755 RepID=A0A5E4E3M8_PRUDU|nr:PREDICTED: vacuolar [Prunus dulcis]
MFTRLFGKPKQEGNALTTLDKLNETLEMLEKKEKVLQKKAAAEVERAKEFTRAKNKRAAIQCLKRKRLYEQQIEQLGNFQLRIHDQMIMLEGAKATTETVDALRTGAAAMKAMQKATNIDDVDKTMDEINEQTENMKQIQEALSAPIGAAADFDEDELEAELEELEGAELEEQLLQPATTAPAAPVQAPAGRLRWHFEQVLFCRMKGGYVKDWSDFIMEICAPIAHPDFCVASLLNRMYIKVA